MTILALSIIKNGLKQVVAHLPALTTTKGDFAMATPRICSIDGCGKPCKTRGWCSAHYQRWRAHGDPFGGRTPDGEPLAFLENTVVPFEGDECLIWPYAKYGNGYGTIWHNGKMRPVHRVVCEADHGPPPSPEHEAAHLCGKGHEGCCNPKHLVWKTPAENQADRQAHGTHWRGERHGNAKLTESQVFEIRSSTKTQRVLAREFGVSYQSISDIKRRKRWSWLEDAC